MGNQEHEENREKLKILFLCTGNSCRSQMAEGIAKHLAKDRLEAWSAGTEKKTVDPLAIEVMKEIGIDISDGTSKLVDELPEDLEFDYVITLCDNAATGCPFFPAKTAVVHHGFEDPPKLSKDADKKEDALPHYRRVRDEIKAFVEGLPDNLNK